MRNRIHANSHASDETELAILKFRNWLCIHQFTGCTIVARIKSSPFLIVITLSRRSERYTVSGYVACSHYKRPAGNQFRKIMAIPPSVNVALVETGINIERSTFKVAALSRVPALHTPRI